MGRQAKISIAWPDEERVYRLRIGELIELQEKCGAGPMAILRRLFDNQWRVEDVRETIRLGLIGGGLPASEAIRLVRRYVEELPIGQAVPHAAAILAAGIMGVDDEPLEEPGAGAGETRATTTASGSPPSTEMGPSSAGRPSRSTPAASGSSAPRSKGIAGRTPPRTRPKT